MSGWCRGQALGGVSLACWRTKKKEAVSSQHTQTATAEQFTPVTPPHPVRTSGDRGGKMWRMKLHLVCRGGWLVVLLVLVLLRCLALMRVKGVSGPRAVDYRAVGSRAADHLSGLFQQLLQRTAGQQIITLLTGDDKISCCIVQHYTDLDEKIDTTLLSLNRRQFS